MAGISVREMPGAGMSGVVLLVVVGVCLAVALVVCSPKSIDMEIGQYSQNNCSKQNINFKELVNVCKLSQESKRRAKSRGNPTQAQGDWRLKQSRSARSVLPDKSLLQPLKSAGRKKRPVPSDDKSSEALGDEPSVIKSSGSGYYAVLMNQMKVKSVSQYGQ